MHKNDPEAGWSNFIKNPLHGEQVKLIWEKIWVVGHSQGAGHAGFLAYSEKLAGAGLVSGPQDNCRDSSGWISESWKTKEVRVFAHEGEDAIDLIKDNWRDIESLKHSLPQDISQLNPQKGKHKVWVTSMTSRHTSVKRPHHKSVILSYHAPLGEKNEFIYANFIWPFIAGSN